MFFKLLKLKAFIVIVAFAHMALAGENTNEIASKKKYLLVLLHGWGGEASHMTELMPYFMETYGQMHPEQDLGSFTDMFEIYAPEAPKKRWFKMPTDDAQKSQLISQGLSGNHVTDDLKEFRDNLTELRANIEKRLNDLGLGYDSLILAGFSMGCIASLTLALESPEPVLAVGGFMGMWMPSHIRSVPSNIMLTNGGKDKMIPAQHSELTKGMLRSKVGDEALHTLMFPKEGHELSPAQLTEFVKFLDKRVFSKQRGYTFYSHEGENFALTHLEHHHVRGPESTVLSQFKFNRELNKGAHSGKFRYDFKHAPVPNRGLFWQRQTEWNDDGNGNTIYLDRHHIVCSSNEAITDFRLVSQNGKIRFEYGCKDVGLTDQKTYETDFNDDGNGHNIYLDRHNVECPSERPLLNSFRLVRDHAEGKRYKFVYQCGVSA